jgi:RND superfamily putative drug exporter
MPTVVRMVLVPTLMELFGRANWWIPRWLERKLPRLDVEPASTPGSG